VNHYISVEVTAIQLYQTNGFSVQVKDMFAQPNSISVVNVSYPKSMSHGISVWATELHAGSYGISMEGRLLHLCTADDTSIPIRESNARLQGVSVAWI